MFLGGDITTGEWPALECVGDDVVGVVAPLSADERFSPFRERLIP